MLLERAFYFVMENPLRLAMALTCWAAFIVAACLFFSGAKK